MYKRVTAESENNSASKIGTELKKSNANTKSLTLLLACLKALVLGEERNVTKRSRIGKLNIDPTWNFHKQNLKEYNAYGKVFEFGAGKSLAQNLYLSNTVNDQLVVDLNPMIELRLVENVREQLSGIVALKSNSKIDKIEDFKKYGIQCKAPYDASKTDLCDRSLDACISTNTLEHIPEASILSIFLNLGAP